MQSTLLPPVSIRQGPGSFHVFYQITNRKFHSTAFARDQLECSFGFLGIRLKAYLHRPERPALYLPKRASAFQQQLLDGDFKIAQRPAA